MVVGYKHHFETVCEQSGQCVRLHDTEISKRVHSQLVAAVDLYDGQETELLLCYNRKYYQQTIAFFVHNFLSSISHIRVIQFN